MEFRGKPFRLLLGESSLFGVKALPLSEQGNRRGRSKAAAPQRRQGRLLGRNHSWAVSDQFIKRTVKEKASATEERWRVIDGLAWAVALRAGDAIGTLLRAGRLHSVAYPVQRELPKDGSCHETKLLLDIPHADKNTSIDFDQQVRRGN